jgi:hypothetical protein
MGSLPVSASTYCNHGCRCDGCKADHAAKQAGYKAKRIAAVERDTQGHPIGKPYSYSTYNNWRCRCVRCTGDRRKA